jgi:hypothetical protein
MSFCQTDSDRPSKRSASTMSRLFFSVVRASSLLPPAEQRFP